MRRWIGLAARTAFGVAGLTFLAVTFWRTWDRSSEVLVPAWWRLVVAFVLLTVAMALTYRAWAQLLPPDVRGRSLSAGFYVSQLGKYVPGGVWQAIGQVGYATRAEVSLPRAATAFVVFAFTQAGAGAVVGAGIALFGTELDGWLRLAVLAPLGILIMLDRRWLVWVITWYRRRRPQPLVSAAPGAIDGDTTVPADTREAVQALVPAQAAILRAGVWCLGVILAMGSAFAVLVTGLVPEASFPTVVSGHAMAWMVGFVAVPFPSGLGIREAVHILLLGPSVGTATLIAASVYFRLAQMLAELVLIAASRNWRAPARATAPRERSGR